ncbi:MAG: type II toxin-antitoxin system PemK/MazF family toxin [Chloroflexota bacterium]
MRHGEVRWYTFKAPDKRRPVLILTRNSAIGFLNALTVAPITTTVREIPTEVFLSREDGMPANCAVNLDNLQTIPKEQIGALITTLSPARLNDVNRALCFALGMDFVTTAF